MKKINLMKTQPFATKLPSELIKALDEVCRRLGLRKNFVVEAALREKIEDLLDTKDLRDAVSEATAYHAWEKVRKEAGRVRRK